MFLRKSTALILIITALLVIFALDVYADQTAGTVAIELPDISQTYSTDGLADGNELAEAYVNRMMSWNRRSFMRAGSYQGDKLTGALSTIYFLMQRDIIDIANGERTSTVLAYDAGTVYEKTEYTAADLGVSSILDENGEFRQESLDAIRGVVMLDMDKVVQALMLDCPYELYWYDKTSGVSVAFPSQIRTDGEVVTISGDVTVYLYVSPDYAKNGADYECDETFGQSAQDAAAIAQSIAEQYASASDHDKLAGYAEEICSLTSYNQQAAAGGVSYGNPWQLVWVFDNNPETTVVCEGYSKAFQYLCNLTSFTADIRVITVTGTMSGGTGSGAHMWNIVRLEDRKNYLVDVTNIDEGTVGYPDQLFLASVTSGDYDSGYNFVISQGTICYEYDEETLNQYSPEELILCGDETRLPVVIDESAFPDAAFREFVSEQFDTDQDGVLSVAELGNITEVWCADKGITSVQGIEFFFNMNLLHANNNSIRSIDVSNNPSLIYLYLDSNQLTSIDVSALADLEYLWVPCNPITEIDVSRNTKLAYLWIGSTQVSSIDVSNNPDLWYLNCQNTLIQELDIRQNPKLVQLICQAVHITSLDLSANTELEQLWLTDTDLTSLDLSHNPKLWQLFCGWNAFACLDLSHNPLITDLRASGICIVMPPSTTSYNMTAFEGFEPGKTSNWTGGSFDPETGLLTNITSPIVSYDYDCGNGLSVAISLYFTADIAVDETTFPDPVFRQYITENFAPDAVLSPDELLHVTDIDVSNMGITTLQGIELFPILTNLRCSGNPISTLTVSSHCIANLFIVYTNISSLDIGYQPDLSYLSMESCRVRELDLSGFPNLIALYCPNNGISSLNVQPCKNLIYFNCNGCSLTSLDLTGLPVEASVSNQYVYTPLPGTVIGDYCIADLSGLDIDLDRVTVPDAVMLDTQNAVALYNGFPGSLIYHYDTGVDDYTLVVTCELEISESEAKLMIPSNVKRIEAEAFYGTAAEVIVIPENCEYIAEDAFSHCSSLKYILNYSDLVIPASEGVAVITIPVL